MVMGMGGGSGGIREADHRKGPRFEGSAFAEAVGVVGFEPCQPLAGATAGPEDLQLLDPGGGIGELAREALGGDGPSRGPGGGGTPPAAPRRPVSPQPSVPPTQPMGGNR